MIFRGGAAHENSMYRGDCLIRRKLEKFADLRGVGKEDGMIPQCTL